MPDVVPLALRLGWTVAEVRGRAWRPRPEPTEPELPTSPLGMLPLRSQRDRAASQTEAVATLRGLVGELRIGDVADELARLGGLGDWARDHAVFTELDDQVQRQLTSRDEDLATAYLLGRGLAECYWSLGDAERTGEGARLGYLFGDERVVELVRMLGRLRAGHVDALTPSAIAGSLEAWRRVAADHEDEYGEAVERPLREQVRRWYQLLVIGQDPTTLVAPGDRLGRWHYLGQALRTFWPQVGIALLALGLTSGFALSWEPVLAALGAGAFAVAGLLAKAQSAAQRVLERMRQDEYTDLVAVRVTDVDGWLTPREVEHAVRARRLTPSTPA